MSYSRKASSGIPEALEVRDNGSGMALEELTEGFLRIANDTKVRSPRSPRYRRMRAGRKGIGRFAAERLGRTLVLTTRAVRDLPGLQLKVNWDDFAPGRELAHVPVIVESSSEAHKVRRCGLSVYATIGLTHSCVAVYAA